MVVINARWGRDKKEKGERTLLSTNLLLDCGIFHPIEAAVAQFGHLRMRDFVGPALSWSGLEDIEAGGCPVTHRRIA